MRYDTKLTRVQACTKHVAHPYCYMMLLIFWWKYIALNPLKYIALLKRKLACPMNDACHTWCVYSRPIKSHRSLLVSCPFWPSMITILPWRVHAADVLRSFHVILHRGGILSLLFPKTMVSASESNEASSPWGITSAHIQSEASATALPLLALYLSAIIHDYGHRGVTNAFLIEDEDPLAVRETYIKRSLHSMWCSQCKYLSPVHTFHA